MTRFVDVHVHPPRAALIEGAETLSMAAPVVGDAPESMDELADHYRSRDGIGLVHAFDAGTTTGMRALSNRRLAELVARHQDALLGLGSVDPHRGAAAVGAVADAKRLGLKGLYFHPPVQRFDPASRMAAPLWEMATDLQLPVVVHAGTTMVGAGSYDGSGVRLDWADPMRLDAVAAGHPDLKIVMVHPTPPWEEHAAAVVRHKSNVFVALSGRTPDRLGPALRDLVFEPGMERILCGTGFPLVDVDEWLAGWEALQPPPADAEAVLVGRAAELFGIDL